MRIIIAFQLAYRSLRLNLLRTSLTVLGVVIGVSAIIIVFSAGSMLSNLVSGEIKSYGTNVIQTEAKAPGNSPNGVVEVTSLKMDDMSAINRISNVSMSYAASLAQQRVSYESQSKKVFIFGTSAPYAQIDSKTKLASGEFFSEDDDKSQAMVAVLGASLKDYLFGNQEAVGKSIKLGSKKFKVVGVLSAQGGGAAFIDFDNIVYVPINTLHKSILGIDYAIYFMHQVRDVNRAPETAEEIKGLLRERHNITNPDKDDFRVSTMEEMLNTLGTVTNAVTYLLLAIVLISLLVGGVGIMNIMYVTVVERTPEIGLRKALGATKKDVVWQFLIESLLITFWGWLLGTILGVIFSFLLTLLAKYFNLNWQFIFPWQGIGASLLFSILCGLLFGYRPAKQAANLDPVEALRIE
ncbi:MAG: ABC transporter permease [Patescibacteria group bacterium]